MGIPHGVTLPEFRTPRLLAAGVGALLQATELMAELGTESARVLLVRCTVAARRAERGYRDAAGRGDLVIGHAAAEASRRLNRAADAAAAWTDRAVVRRVTASLTPYLIEELVPEVIDGILPKIRADVVPAVIEDLAGDENVRTMVAQQSQDTLAWSVAEVRRAGAEGDTRVESALHRVLGRRDAGT